MNDRQPFLDAIEAAPWDDEQPRLVYADWLDEHDEPEEAERQRQWVASATWLREFAAENSDEYEDVAYEDLLRIGQEVVKEGHAHCGFLEGLCSELRYSGTRIDFLRHWSTVTGIAVPEEKAATASFSCAC